MKTSKLARIGLALVVIAFGALTLFLSTSVLLDLFGIRERESPYVPAVVVANLIASLLYLPAGAGLLMQRRWPTVLLAAAVVVLVGGLLLALHINSGGEYRTATIGALTFRTLLTAAFYVIAARWSLRSHRTNNIPDHEPPSCFPSFCLPSPR
ncbi:MAG: hypothetical protein V9G12_12005 [Microthrixaceae bacterium]